MSDIDNKEGFLKNLSSFLGEKFINEEKTKIVEVLELEESGKGSIFLDFRKYKTDNKRFILQIEHSSKHGSAGKSFLSTKICDGIVLYVDLINKKINFFLCELKTKITTQTFEKAQWQLSSALTMINNLGFHRTKFEIKLHTIVGYKEAAGFDAFMLRQETKRIKPVIEELHTSWVRNRDIIPIVNIFDDYSMIKFSKVKFGNNLIV